MATAKSRNGQPKNNEACGPLPPTLLRFPFNYVTVFTIMAQVISLVVVYMLGLTLHHRRLVWTHCDVPNFWPSISKVTGNNLLERYIWRLVVALISFPRIMDAVLYYHFFATLNPFLLQKKWYKWLNRINSFLYVTQLLLYFTCVFITSLENIDIHEKSWIAFLIISLMHMVTFLILFGLGCQKPMKKKERTSLILRGVFFGVYFATVLVFIYFAIMHHNYCQPYAYSIAAICENIIAASNLAFHAVQLLDFHSLEMCYCYVSAKKDLKTQ